MSRKEDIYIPALEGKKVPLLTLDNKWHKLFTQANFNDKIKGLEEELNELLKRQGKLTTETKDIKKIKKKLMDEIVELRDNAEKEGSKSANKKLDEHTRLINECSEKLEEYQDELLDLPKEIDKINGQLMLETMEVCYRVIGDNTKDIKEIADWISHVRVELKKNIVRKQEKELMNQELYTYMHDIFGAQVIEIFDMKYNPSEKPIKESEKK